MYFFGVADTCMSTKMAPKASHWLTHFLHLIPPGTEQNWVEFVLKKQVLNILIPLLCLCFGADQSTKVAIRTQVHGIRPPSRNFFFRPEGYSDKPNG